MADKYVDGRVIQTTRHQIKNLSSTLSGTGTIAQFNNLIIGRGYMLNWLIHIEDQSGGAVLDCEIQHPAGGATLQDISFTRTASGSTNSDMRYTQSGAWFFIATDTSVSIEVVNRTASGRVAGPESRAQIIEMPTETAQTTAFT